MNTQPVTSFFPLKKSEQQLADLTYRFIGKKARERTYLTINLSLEVNRRLFNLHIANFYLYKRLVVVEVLPDIIAFGMSVVCKEKIIFFSFLLLVP